MLVGRDRERAALMGLLAQARAGQGAALVLRGDPGMGKTALLNDVVENAGDVRVLRTRGVESESPLAFAALHRLLLPLARRMAELPSPQARALSRAFGSVTDSGQDDRFLVFLAALTLLTEAAEESPVLCVIDDAHWLDDASLAALLFIARRVEFASVALLFAVRDGELRTVDAPDLPALTLRGLDTAAAEELLRECDPGLAPHVRAQLIQRTDGNPLALLEIPKALSAAQLTGQSELPEHLPLGADLERGFAARAGLLGVAAQRFLLLAALDDSGDAGILGSAARRLDVADEALDEVARSGLVELGQEVYFRHPLVRSAVYGAALPGERRRVHQALAGAFEDHHDPDRAVWHSAAATDVPDEQTAARLEEAGLRFQQRGGHEAATAAFERAAQLSTAEAAVGPRLSKAAVAAWLAGNPERTRALAQRALAAVSEAGAVADLDRLRAFVEISFGSPRLAHGILADAARKAGEVGDLQRARQYSMIATALATFEADSGVPVAVQSLARLDAADPVELCFSTLLVGLDGFAHGRVAEGSPLLRRAIELAEVADAPDLVTNIGIAALHVGDDDLALRWHDRQLDAARLQASVLGVIHALTRRAVAQLAMGRWADVAAASAEVLDLARATAHDNQRALPLAHMLVVDALRGADDIPVRGDDIEQLLRAHPSGVLEVLSLDTVRWARGVHAARTTPSSALQQFDAITLPMIRRAATIDIIEAAQRAGDTGTGRRVARELHGFAEATGNAWAKAYAAHAAALVAPEGEREQLFEDTLEYHRSAARPFASARAELAYGELLRRHRRRVDSRGHLRAALVLFEGVGATAWATRATEELRASGETARGRTDTHAPVGLTAQELQVAHLVQDGLSNREVAARLFLSPRTVEFHLRNIFAKLGIASRAALTKEDLPTAPL